MTDIDQLRATLDRDGVAWTKRFARAKLSVTRSFRWSPERVAATM